MACLAAQGTGATSCAIKNVGTDSQSVLIFLPVQGNGPYISLNDLILSIIKSFDIGVQAGFSSLAMDRRGFQIPHWVELKYTDRRGFLTSWINARKSMQDKNVPPIVFGDTIHGYAGFSNPACHCGTPRICSQ